MVSVAVLLGFLSMTVPVIITQISINSFLTGEWGDGLFDEPTVDEVDKSGQTLNREVWNGVDKKVLKVTRPPMQWIYEPVVAMAKHEMTGKQEMSR